MSEDGEVNGAENTALWRACAHTCVKLYSSLSGKSVVTEEVQYPCAQ